MPKSSAVLDRALHENDLSKSNIKNATAKHCKIKYIPEAQAQKIITKHPRTRKPVQGPLTEYQYFDLDGKPLKYKRYKIHAPQVLPFSGIAAEPLKYWQPPKSKSQPLYPPLFPWREVADDIELPIAITEGEKKSILLCQTGIPCIGLGGVYGFMSNKNGYLFDPSMDEITWDGRTVYIVYDNDLRDNQDVQLAMIRLAQQLNKRGAIIYFKYIPYEKGKKLGIDDYLLPYTKKSEAYDAFEDLEEEAFITCEKMHELNNEVFFIGKLNAYYDLKYETIIASAALAGTQRFANYLHVVGDGDSAREVSTFKEWNKWSCRRTYDKLVYKPNYATVEDGEYNLYKGLGVEPVDGDIQPFLDLFEHVFGELSQEHQHWVWQWLAYPLQNPGTKNINAIVVGGGQGQGKSFIGAIMGDIYGLNFSRINHSQLSGDYNAWAKNKQFVLGDELFDTGKRSQASTFKSMLDREKLTVNEKYKPHYDLDDCINYYFTSNHHNAVYMDKDDRRYFVHWIKSLKKPPAFYNRLDTWRFNEGGPAILLNYLLTKVDCKSFSPKEEPPRTEAKDDMTYDSYSEVEKFCFDLERDPDYFLTVAGITRKADLYTPTQLYEIYADHYPHRPSSSTAFGNAYRSVTNFAIKKGVRLYARNGKQKTRQLPLLLAIRNSELWDKKSSVDWAEHFENHNQPKRRSRDNKAIKKRSSNVVELNPKKK